MIFLQTTSAARALLAPLPKQSFARDVARPTSRLRNETSIRRIVKHVAGYNASL